MSGSCDFPTERANPLSFLAKVIDMLVITFQLNSVTCNICSTSIVECQISVSHMIKIFAATLERDVSLRR